MATPKKLPSRTENALLKILDDQGLMRVLNGVWLFIEHDIEIPQEVYQEESKREAFTKPLKAVQAHLEQATKALEDAQNPDAIQPGFWGKLAAMLLGKPSSPIAPLTDNARHVLNAMLRKYGLAPVLESCWEFVEYQLPIPKAIVDDDVKRPAFMAPYREAQEHISEAINELEGYVLHNKDSRKEVPFLEGAAGKFLNNPTRGKRR